MHENLFSLDKFNKCPVVGILRGFSLSEVLKIIPLYMKCGFYTAEVTMNSPEPLKIIKELRQSFPELNIGAGTVCSMHDLINALEAGSQYIVTPIVNEEVIKYCVNHNISVFPGAYTPTEVYKAWDLGANAVKVFPATQLGIRYIKDIMGPLNKIKLIPTGGVSKNNIADFFKLGCVGVGMGSSLFDKEIINSGNYEKLTEHFTEIQNAKNK